MPLALATIAKPSETALGGLGLDDHSSALISASTHLRLWSNSAIKAPTTILNKSPTKRQPASTNDSDNAVTLRHF